MPSEFSRRPFAGVFDPTETPASLPAPPEGGAPLPLPPSLAGTPAPSVTESGGGAGAFLKQMGPLIMAMLAARNPGARGAFLQGWQRAQQIEQEQTTRQRQQELYERQLDEASAGRQERAEEAKRTRAERLRAAAEARVRNLVDELGSIADPDAFKSRVRSADEQLASEFGEAYTPGALGQRAQMREPDYAKADPAIKRILRQIKDDEAAKQVLEQSQYKAAAYALGYLLEDEQGQVMLFRDPEPVTAADTPSLQSKVVVVNGERRLANFNPKTGKYDVVEGVMPESDKEPSPESPISPYAKERAIRNVQAVDELLPQINRWTTGYGSLLNKIPETDALSFRAQLDTLVANISFGELTAMREASKTGGALGQVSDRETKLLSATLGALEQAQSPAQIKTQLEKVKASIQRWYEAMAGEPLEVPNASTVGSGFGLTYEDYLRSKRKGGG